MPTTKGDPLTYLFDQACETHNCPKCLGFVVGPQWDTTLQGKVWTAYCLNCGWRANHQSIAIDYSMPKDQVAPHELKMKQITKQREIVKIRTRDLSRYNFGE